MPIRAGLAGEEAVDAGSADANVETVDLAVAVILVIVGGAGGVQEFLDPADVVPADGDRRAQAVVGEIEGQIEVAFKETLGELSMELLVIGVEF